MPRIPVSVRRATVIATAVAATITVAPSVGAVDSHPQAQTQLSPTQETPSTNAPARRAWIADLGGRDAAPEYNAQGMWVYPRFKRGWLFVQISGHNLRPSRKFNGARVYLQTGGGSRPDWRVTYRLPGDGDGTAGVGLSRIRGWDSPGHLVGCSRLYAKWRVNVRKVEFGIPRGCIHRHGRVRVNGETWNYTRYRHGDPVYGRYDAVPATDRLSRWI
ncbi:MAG TPA: hypothetical protein VEX15_05980 [Nocardioidaceae bacterium]|nr:hypothetical protein [Nocardioidaceae bacterium]